MCTKYLFIVFFSTNKLNPLQVKNYSCNKRRMCDKYGHTLVWFRPHGVSMRDTDAITTIHSNFIRDTSKRASEPSIVLSFCFIFHIAINAIRSTERSVRALTNTPLASGGPSLFSPFCPFLDFLAASRVSPRLFFNAVRVRDCLYKMFSVYRDTLYYEFAREF